MQFACTRLGISVAWLITREPLVAEERNPEAAIVQKVNPSAEACESYRFTVMIFSTNWSDKKVEFCKLKFRIIQRMKSLTSQFEEMQKLELTEKPTPIVFDLRGPICVIPSGIHQRF